MLMSNQQSKIDIINEIKKEYLGYFENWLSTSGINPYIARIMQLLRSENRALTQKEMKEILDLSIPTISRNLKIMDQMNLLKISLISPTEKSGDKYEYELQDNSLFYIINTFVNRIYDSFKQRVDDNKVIMNKIENLSNEERKKKEIQNLVRIISEEVSVFDIMSEKFDQLIKELEMDLATAKKKLQ